MNRVKQLSLKNDLGDRMLGWLLLGVLIGAAVITIAVSCLDKDTAKKEMKDRNIRKAVVREMSTSDGVHHVSLDALDENGNEQKIEFVAEDIIRNQIYEGAVITV